MIRDWCRIIRLWWSKSHPKFLRILNHTRFTLAIGTFMLVFTIVSQFLSHGQGFWPILVNRWGWDLATVQQGRIYFAWTGLFFATAPLNFYGVLLLLLITIGALEYRRSTRWAALGFFVIGPVASIITLMLLWPISNAGIKYVRVALFTPDMGASTACLVCLGMLLTNEKGLWRNILLFSVLIILVGFVFQNTAYNIDHLNGYLIGMATGAFLLWRKGRRQPHGHKAP
jgi:hypothetical protein